MHTPLTWQGLTLLSLSTAVSSIPLFAHTGLSPADIWVTHANTLNATTWNNGTKIAANNMTRRATFDRTRRFVLPNASENATNSVYMSPLVQKSPNGAQGLNIPYPVDTTITPSMPQPRDDSSNPEVVRLVWDGETWKAIEVPLDATTPTSDDGDDESCPDDTSSDGSKSTSGTTPSSTTTSNGATEPTNTAAPASQSDAPVIDGDTTSSGKALAWNAAAAGNGALRVNVVNKMPSSNVKCYISGLSPAGALIMLGRNGQWVYPSTSSSTPQVVQADVAIPLGAQGQTTQLTLPGFISSARVWFSDGGLTFYVVGTPNGPGLVEPAVANPNDANSEKNWGFAELTWIDNYGLYADISAVDFVGIPIGLTLQETNGANQQVLGLPANGVSQACDRLKAQAKIDGRPWDELCTYGSSGNLIRVVSPTVYQSQVPNSFGTYFGWLINDAWNYYRNNDLIINTQAAAGNVICRVQGDQLQCAGDNRGYSKPNVGDIFGCNTGPFAIQSSDNQVHLAVVPRLCAAINRATLLIPGGNVQPSLPPSRYYKAYNRPVQSRPMNHYSRVVHEIESNGRGYAFSYDDVTPSAGQDQSGFVNSGSPQLLTLIVGGF